MMDNIDIYNGPSHILNKKSNIYIIIWSIVLFAFLITSVLIIIFYKFYLYETCLGYVKKIDDYKVVTYLKDFNKLNDYRIYLDDELVDFSVYSISSDYYIIDNEDYYEIVLNMDLNDSHKIENNILNLKIRKEQTTYLERIKKGLGL